MAITVKYALHPSILTCFWLGLVTTHNATQYPEVIEELPHELCSTVRYQQWLGWDQLYYDRLAQHWARAIDDLHPHLAISGQQVLTKFVQTVWAYVLATWSTCNQQLHNNARQLSLPDYQQAVTTLYEMSQQLPPDAQAALFRRPLQETLDQPPAVLRPLVERGYKYMRQQLKAVKTQARLNTPDIRSFFRTTTQSVNDLQPL